MTNLNGLEAVGNSEITTQGLFVQKRSGRITQAFVITKALTTFKKENLLPSVKYCGVGVMMWGSMTACGRGNFEYFYTLRTI